MTRRRRALCAALVGAALQFSASLAVAAQLVVCRSPDGHVEIESALDGDCCPTGGFARNVQELRASEACDGCVDTPLLRAGLSAPLKATFDAVAPAPWRVTPVSVLRGAAWLASPATAASARWPRSVVLLI